MVTRLLAKIDPRRDRRNGAVPDRRHGATDPVAGRKATPEVTWHQETALRAVLDRWQWRRGWLAAYGRADQLQSEDHTGKWRDKVSRYKPKLQADDPAHASINPYSEATSFLFPKLTPHCLLAGGASQF